ncbi:ABC transporter substrate-binding protein [Pseudoroseicyclus aestuarii]|uniref:Putative spermidine/putrescine transport system substrate-binding protein n=1 Tax=Pseudoroseicyclus aestuarii TaxID=1795041 RepID=A0A318T4T8_9RHOB|nr:ABC transporter substrate-binding protein [Pseudoroseicyclus aestuarii]PYE85364.1 putative spermidine/putrescine transport system substrate-binding protein [Pseudoroseicyclus aestuarii]
MTFRLSSSAARRALLAGLSLPLMAASAHAQDQLTISWWGYNGDKLQANIIEPFEAMCDCEVVFETGNNADRLNKLIARGGQGIDVIFLTDSFSQIGIEAGVFQEVDRSALPNVDKLYDLAQAPQGEAYGPAYSIGRVGIVYDSERVEPLTSWDDLWRDDLAGAISLPGITTTAGPMVVLKAGEHAGVSAYDDPEGAFGAIQELEANVAKTYNTGSEMVNLISTGEASVAVAQDFTFSSLQDAVPSMVWAELEGGDVATLNTVNIPTGAAEPELAHEFINFLLSTEVQQIEAEQGVDAPVNTEVELTEDQAAMWTYGAEQVGSLELVDYAALNGAKTGWIDRWNEVFGM